MEGGGGHTDVGGDPTDVDIRDALLPDHLLQAGLPKLGVIKECAVGVNVGIDSFVYNLAVWVDLTTLNTKNKGLTETVSKHRWPE